ncbi:MAG: hypothetical protein R3E98_14520 [Gemmatimonadota bacterium]
MRMVTRAAILSGVALAVTGVEASGQAVPRLVREARFAEGFGLVNRARELPDGRVLVADPLSKTLQVVDFASGRSEAIGREGQGPEEYRQPDAVHALPGGRTLLVDLGNARLTELGPDLSFGRTHPLATGSPGPGGNFEPRLPAAVDGEGRVYYQAMGMSPGGQLPTHAQVKRWDLTTGAVEVVGEVALPDREDRVSGGPNNQQRQIRQIPLAAADGWAVARDGRVAFVRSGSTWHVEWVGAGAGPVTGPPVRYQPVRIGTAEKREWVETAAQRGGGVGISVEMDNGSVRTSFARGGGSRSAIDDYTWPETKPAFEPGDIQVDPQGRVWVRLHREAGEAPLYAIVDANGRPLGEVELEPDRRLIGFGDGTAYVVHVDDMDLQYLERYRLEG